MCSRACRVYACISAEMHCGTTEHLAPFSGSGDTTAVAKPLGLVLVMQQQQSTRLAAIRRSVRTKVARKKVASTAKLVATQMVA